MLKTGWVQGSEKAQGARRAAVIGGGIGGLLAARVLADHFEEVLLIERDHFPEGAEHRPGVAQARHLHLLLKRGLMVVERLFPGIREDLLAAGSHQVDQGADYRILYRYGMAPDKPHDLDILTFTRPLLESTIRRHLAVQPNVRFLEGFQVAGLATGDDHARVTGVRIVPRRHAAGETEEQILQADLVVDSSGRMSAAPQWLEEIGYSAPSETEVDAFWGYGTRLYEVPAGWKADWKIFLSMNRPPYQTRAGIIEPVEGGRWLVTLAGVMHDYPPTDEEGYLAFARSLASQEVYRAISQAKPVSKIIGYRRLSNRLRHYEQLSRLPQGFVLVGDSVCSVNPVYGLGMTLTSLTVEHLETSLLASRGGRDLDPLTFQKAIGKLVMGPFAMTTGEDLRWPATQGGEITLKVKVMHWYLDQVIRLIPDSPEVYLAFQKVNHMLEAPESLFRPATLFRVLKQALTPAKAPKPLAAPAAAPAAVEPRASAVSLRR